VAVPLGIDAVRQGRSSRCAGWTSTTHLCQGTGDTQPPRPPRASVHPEGGGAPRHRHGSTGRRPSRGRSPCVKGAAVKPSRRHPTCGGARTDSAGSRGLSSVVSVTSGLPLRNLTGVETTPFSAGRLPMRRQRERGFFPDLTLSLFRPGPIPDEIVVSRCDQQRRVMAGACQSSPRVRGRLVPELVSVGT
jgi:hypothetical protein